MPRALWTINILTKANRISFIQINNTINHSHSSCYIWSVGNLKQYYELSVNYDDTLECFHKLDTLKKKTRR